MVPLAEAVDGVYYINLERRPDRRAEIERELERMGLTHLARRIIAFEGGFTGCTRSHLFAIEDAIRRGFKTVAVFEDDFQPLQDNIVVPDAAFDVVQLCANFAPRFDPRTAAVGRGMIRVRQSLTSAGMVIRKRYFLTWRRVLRDALRKSVPLDVEMQLHQPHGVWLSYDPPVAQQRASAGSDIPL